MGGRPKFEWNAGKADNDPWDVAREAGINILSNKEFVGGYVVDDQWVAVLFEAADHDGYEFDVAVDPEWQRKGLGSDLTDMALERFYDFEDAYGPDFSFNVDVVNKHMIRMLKRRGFEITDTYGSHTMMTRTASTIETPPSGFLGGSMFKMTMFHGSSKRLGQGYTLRPDKGSEFGIYVSPKHRYARAYGGNLHRVLVSVKNPLIVEGKHEISPKDLTRNDVREIERKGYDSIVVTSGGMSQASEVVLFHPKQAWVMSMAAGRTAAMRDVGFSEHEGETFWGNAGSGILFTTGEKILLLKRSGSVEQPGTWGIPGGAIPEDWETGKMDSPMTSAKREVKEEVGMMPSFSVEGKTTFSKGDFTFTTFIGRVSKEFKPKLDWENSDWAWVSKDELSSYRLHFGVKYTLGKKNPFDRAVTASSYWYHGSSEKFDHFEVHTGETFGTGPSKTPLFFSPDESFAKMNAGGRGTIYKVKLKWRKIFDSKNLYKSSKYWPPEREGMTTEGQKLYDDLADGKIFGQLSDSEFMDSQGLLASILNLHYDVIESSEFKRWMKKNGYDAFYVRGDGPTNVGVFKPSQVTIVDSYSARSASREASDSSIVSLVEKSGIIPEVTKGGAVTPRKTALPKRDRKYGVGKKMPDATYVHRMYEDVFPGDELEAAKALLPPGFDYDIVKYAGNGNFGFSESRDFDRAAEPTQNVSYSVRNGVAKKISPSSDPWIYHHKWLFVEDGYSGFDVEDAKERSRQWLIAVRDMKTKDPRIFSKIGKKSFWEAIEVDSLVDTSAVALGEPQPLRAKEDGAYMEVAYGTKRFVLVVMEGIMYTALKRNGDPVTEMEIQSMNSNGLSKAFNRLMSKTKGLTRP